MSSSAAVVSVCPNTGGAERADDQPALATGEQVLLGLDILLAGEDVWGIETFDQRILHTLVVGEYQERAVSGGKEVVDPFLGCPYLRFAHEAVPVVQLHEALGQAPDAFLSPSLSSR